MFETFRKASVASVCLAVLVSLTACGGREEEYRQAVEALDEANAQREEAAQTLRATLAELDATRAQLKRAQDEVDASRQELAEARKEVIGTADDIVLFRVIQRKLLEDEALKDTAVTAVVRHQVVTLRGMANESEAAYAQRLAASQPGVEAVRNEIVMPQSASDATPTSKESGS